MIVCILDGLKSVVLGRYLKLECDYLAGYELLHGFKSEEMFLPIAYVISFITPNEVH